MAAFLQLQRAYRELTEADELATDDTEGPRELPGAHELMRNHRSLVESWCVCAAGGCKTGA